MALYLLALSDVCTDFCLWVQVRVQALSVKNKYIDISRLYDISESGLAPLV